MVEQLILISHCSVSQGRTGAIYLLINHTGANVRDRNNIAICSVHAHYITIRLSLVGRAFWCRLNMETAAKYAHY